MIPNTAGAYPINCYLVTGRDGPLVILVDPLYNHLLDLKGQYVVEDISGGYPWLPTSDGTGGNATSEVGVMGRIKIGHRSLVYTEKTYLGRFDSHPFGMRFVPASRSPEIALHD
jgi:hypothetical protein